MAPTPNADDTLELLRRLADRDRARSEASIQADVRQLLLTGGLNLADHDLMVDLEAPVGDGRRIDVEVGFTVIEIKTSLRTAAALKKAEEQLRGYVATRNEQTDQVYVGVLTDGANWRAYRLHDGQLVLATEHTLKSGKPDGDALLVWLEGVLSTRQDILPTPAEIVRRLGASSASHALDRATLSSLYALHGTKPTVQLKRQLWARLLRSALGTQFEDSDALFIEHTMLVNSAEIIAHLVLGIPVKEMQPASILAGRRFAQAQVYGVVEEDFFDWVLEVPGGAELIRTIARRLSRFSWSHVEHDVLKVLYESVIGSETRKSLGEYYTPDWLAESVVNEAVPRPLEQKVLDPACGSGTFLFHAARRYLESAEEAGLSLEAALKGLTQNVAGVDLHPVAVALARVTYVLAIGRARLESSERGAITIPVYLGDSVQWQQRQDLFDQDYLVIRTGAGDQLFENELRFPDRLLEDAARFDRLVSEMADLAIRPRKRGSTPSLSPLFNRLAILKEDRADIEQNFALLCQLVDEGRNHIWSYYVRNLARPMWMARKENRVDVLVGNPPWLSYRHMPAEMQDTFRQMSTDLRLWQGREVATQQDLSGLFVARAVQQYLSHEGSFAFVLPNAVLDRGYWKGFRNGRYLDPIEPIEVAFSGSWDLRRVRPHFFPRGGSVVFGRRVGQSSAVAMSRTTLQFSGKIPRDAHDWKTVHPHLHQKEAQLSLAEDTLLNSPYRPRFENGATVYPRMLIFVDQQQAGPLGLGAGRTKVQSTRSSTEKMPWKSLDPLSGVVESEFVHPVLLGESIVPFRVLPPRTAVLPIEGNTVLDSQHPHLDMYPGLAEWWRQAEALWLEHGNPKMSLTEQLDFRRKLTVQLPTTPLRVVYAKAGMHVVACLVDKPQVLIDHTLYWGTVTSVEEGLFLCAIMNAPIITELARPLMSYGKDERHIDKHLWKLPIPLYNAEDPRHRRLAELGASDAAHVASLPIDEGANFVTLRRSVRAELSTREHADEVEMLVIELLDQ